MDTVLAVALIPAMVMFGVAWAAFGTPAGLLPLLVTRRQRYEYRHWLMNRRWRPRPRGRQRSARISARLRAMVLRADKNRCVFCLSPVALQVDHIVPWSLGGLTCLWNCAALCAPHNKIKSNYWRSESGQVLYRPWKGWAGKGTAAAILSVEMEARRSPLRWLRAFGFLPGW